MSNEDGGRKKEYMKKLLIHLINRVEKLENVSLNK